MKCNIRICLITLLGIFLNACATIPLEECATLNWMDKGREDGSNGQKVSLLEKHKKSCKKAGVVPDKAAYNQGRTEGLKGYCTLRSAVETGLRGDPYYGVCPPPLHTKFSQIHTAAHDIYNARQEEKTLKSSLGVSERALMKDDLSAEKTREIAVKISQDNRELRIKQQAIELKEAKFEQLKKETGVK